MINNYLNYVNSFYTNDTKILQKYKNQAKTVGVLAATGGVAAAAATLLSNNKSKLFSGIMAILCLFGALNARNYVKQIDKNLDKLNINV